MWRKNPYIRILVLLYHGTNAYTTKQTLERTKVFRTAQPQHNEQSFV